ncbi:hypothetical protein DV515_00008960 [Chloebia gouldiae]|uniref:Uncharacterized protein n=1 Tax=Chloebia gouldiae TaxID=44316 RepID=A0A3L8SD91_CHLGU|nr:hypothetical protein DV515_00008960 [Chloebia gouldiae]
MVPLDTPTASSHQLINELRKGLINPKEDQTDDHIPQPRFMAQSPLLLPSSAGAACTVSPKPAPALTPGRCRDGDISPCATSRVPPASPASAFASVLLLPWGQTSGQRVPALLLQGKSQLCFAKNKSISRICFMPMGWRIPD